MSKVYKTLLFLPMPSMVVSEDRIRIFNYYHDGQVHQGMTCQNKLYRFVASFSIQERPQAYVLGCKLNERGARTVISHKCDCYNVWLELNADWNGATC